MDNGFELDALKYLNPGCSCNFYKDSKDSVVIYKDFMRKNYAKLKKYETEAFNRYFKTLDKNLIIHLFKNHVMDELYKNYHEELKYGPAKQKEVYQFVLNNNYKWLDSLIRNNIGIGDRNLGRYSSRMISALNIHQYDPEELSSFYIKKYRLQNKGRVIPIITINDYFSNSALYTTFYHDRKRYFELIREFQGLMIGGGYVHPREYAYLYYSQISRGNFKGQNICLDPVAFQNCENSSEINEIRNKFNLSSIELDKAKHTFAHKHSLHLFFGFLNATR